jgi:ribonuclease R
VADGSVELGLSMISARCIVDYMKERGYAPMRARALARALGADGETYHEFRQALAELHQQGLVVRGGGGRLSLTEPSGTLRGVIDVAAGGFGFVAPETGGPDIYVNARDTGGALDRDTVLVQVTGKGRRPGEGPQGRVLKVVERGRQHLVGTYHEQDGRGFIIPDGDLSYLRIPVTPGEVGHVSERDKVVVKLPPPEAGYEAVTGALVEVLGKSGAVGVDELSVIREFELREKFPPEVTASAHRLARGPKEHDSRRRDLRRWLTVTIDPAEARDFDDAISVRQLAEGGWELGVHIADVSHFVSPGSDLDEEARLRGTSVYFPGFAIPMLPEDLSSDACSLCPKKDRLTKTVLLAFDGTGRVTKEEVWPSVIHSAARLTYEEAADVLAGKAGPAGAAVDETLRQAEALGRALHRVRLEGGALELDIPELEVVVDDRGRVTRIEPRPRTWAHRLIEEAMVAANEAVARLLQRENLPGLYRVHADPDPVEVTEFQEFARSLGFRSQKRDLRRRLQDILTQAAGTPLAYTVHLALLKSTRRAEYVPECLGHFALASDAYCHFTSPIRRYPDLIVHQALDAWFSTRLGSPKSGGTRHGREKEADHARLPEVAAQATEAERTADAAEGAITEVKILRYLMAHADRTFTGVITGVRQFGLFVQLDQLIIEGLVRRESLPPGRYNLVPGRHLLAGPTPKENFQLGERVEVTIKDIDLAARQVELLLVKKLHQGKPGRDVTK